jgi:hypothetical protein
MNSAPAASLRNVLTANFHAHLSDRPITRLKTRVKSMEIHHDIPRRRRAER